jgi:lipopolysaccharide transport protein LptA
VCEAARGKGSPTRIRSDVIDVKRKSQQINFLKNVVVEKDDSSLLAEKMTVLYYEKKNDSQKSKIKKIEAHENVKIFSEEFVGSGDYGFYDPEKNIFVLERNVVVNNGTSIASGDKFLYDLITKKGRFLGKKDETSITGSGSDKRVMVILGSDAKEIKKPKIQQYEQ